MTPEALQTLQQIGRQLDNSIFPAVHNGGFVMPCETGVSKLKGEVTNDERQRSRRSKTRPREGSTGWQRATSETSPIVITDLQAQYESELSAVCEAYPKTQVLKQPGGMILLTESAVLYGYDRTATFLVAIPYAKRSIVRGWGFWGISILGFEWIGPLRVSKIIDGFTPVFDHII